MSNNNENKDLEKDEKLSAVGEPQAKSVSKWFENIWYHYKFRILVGIFVVITVVIAMTQLINREKIDYNVLYAGPKSIAVQDIATIESVFSRVGEDQNGDGTVDVAISEILMMSDDEMAAAQAAGVKVDPNFMMNSKSEFSQQIVGGDAVICLVSPYVHSMLVEAEGLMKISDVLGYVPDSAYGEYGVMFIDTDFGYYYFGDNYLPEDTILCVRTLSTAAPMKGKDKTTAAHEASVELFKEMMAYEIPDEEADTKIVTEAQSLVEN